MSSGSSGLRSSLLLRNAHRKVACLWHNINCLRDLRIISSDKDAVSCHSTIGGCDQVEACLNLYKVTVPINHRWCDFESRVTGSKISEGPEESVCDLELVGLQFVTEIYFTLKFTRFEAADSTVDQLTSESKGRAQKPTLAQTYTSWTHT